MTAKHMICPTVVIHITDHTEHVPITELGLNRVRKLIDIAEEQEINLAFWINLRAY